MPLTLYIEDQDILEKLQRYSSSEAEQEQVALLALRLGLEGMSVMRTELDKRVLQEVGADVLAQIQGVVEGALITHGQNLLEQFSLDKPDSTMSRFQDMNMRHFTELHSAIDATLIRRQEQRRSTQGGIVFEDAVGNVLSSFVNAANDQLEPVGDVEGLISRCKVGDYVITLGDGHRCAGEKIVVEAKRDMAYTRAKALDECRTACQNRGAQIAIFIWDRSSGEAKRQPPLVRDGNHIILLWDAEDPSTDIYVSAAFWMARSLVTPRAESQGIAQVQRKLLDQAIEHISDLSAVLEKIKKSGEEVTKRGHDIVTLTLTVQSSLSAQIEAIRSQSEAMYQ